MPSLKHKPGLRSPQEAIHIVGRRGPRLFRVAIAGCLLSLVTACSTSPRVPRYEPPPLVELDQRLVQWGDSVWSTAKTGDVKRLDALFTEAPPGAKPLAEEWGRVRALQKDADASRRRRARELCNALEEIDASEDIASLVELVDLRSTGLPESLDHRAGDLIDRAIDHWTAEAIRRTDEDRHLDASRAWINVSELAADKHHPQLEVTSLDRAARTVALTGAVSESGVLSWHDIERVLTSLVRNHVDGPTWRTLVQAGFSAVQAVCRDTNGDVEPIIVDIQRWFDTNVESIPDGTSVPAALDRPLRELCGRWWSDYLSERPNEDRPDLIAIFIAGMFKATDPRSKAYIGRDADRFLDQFNDRYLGIGTEITLTVDGMTLRPLPGGPAKRAGIVENDVLISVDGLDTTDLALIDVVRRIQGPRHSSVRLGILSDGDTSPRYVDVVRDHVHRVSVHGWRQSGVDARGLPTWDWIIDDAAGIAYISIRDFLPVTADLFRAAMRDAGRELGPGRQVNGLLLDLRGDPGGDRLTTEEILDLFIDDGRLFLVEDRRGRLDGRRASRSRTKLEGLPIAVMIDEGSASASEILAGTLQGVGNAVVVGERSFGKGSVQRVRQNGDVLMIITESWFHVPGRDGRHRPIDRFRDAENWGLTPDLSSPATAEEGRRAVERRSAWFSGQGRDVPDATDATDGPFDPMRCTDRTLLESLVLLQAGLAPLRSRPPSDQWAPELSSSSDSR